MGGDAQPGNDAQRAPVSQAAGARSEPLAEVVVQSDNLDVRAMLGRVFPALPGREGLYLASGPDAVVSLHDLLSMFSVIEAGAIRAVVRGDDRGYDPWQAQPLEKVLARFATGWLGEMLDAAGVGVHFQPIVEARSLRVHGLECLVRSGESHPDRTPGEMFDAARAHDALHRLDRCAQEASISMGAGRLLHGERLFINIMPMTIYDPERSLRATIEAADRAGIEFARLVFEIVESEQFPDISHLRAILSAYRRAGASVALDDLGAGNTALNYIEHLEPDYIKLDRELIACAARDDEQELLGGLIRHAKRRGITVIAEGIETRRELAMVRRHGVDLVQGWLIARPHPEPVRVFDPLLREPGSA